MVALATFSCADSTKLTEEEMKVIAHESNSKLEKAF
jgi:hypothetical protein